MHTETKECKFQWEFLETPSPLILNLSTVTEDQVTVESGHSIEL